MVTADWLPHLLINNDAALKAVGEECTVCKYQFISPLLVVCIDIESSKLHLYLSRQGKHLSGIIGRFLP